MPKRKIRRARKLPQWQKYENDGELDHTLRADLNQGLRDKSNWRIMLPKLRKKVGDLEKKVAIVRAHQAPIKPEVRLIVEFNALFAKMKLLYLQHLMAGHAGMPSRYMKELKQLVPAYHKRFHDVEKWALSEESK